ncbi:MAG: hypothetical protein DMF74_05225 [Acidobacteria bacterium]|nr:MAG: hypothetical protein DMF74_05225 [Acidobacteriota bacterium]
MIEIQSAVAAALCRRTLKVDSAKMTNSNSKCPRCGEGRLLSWRVLSEEEREVVRRLPASADYSLDERKATHRWCTRCWYEDSSGSTTLA